MTNNPHVSVVIPVYNTEKYLSACLESVLSQTLTNIEIVCVNDGATDCSASILENYAKRDSRVIVIRKDNQGVAAARNDGINAAKGEFVCFIDSDDVYPDKDILEVLYKKAKNNNVDICGGSMVHFESARPQVLRPSGYQGETFEEEGLVRFSDYQFDYGFTRFIYNRCFLNQYCIRFPLLTMFEDPPFLVHALHHVHSFYAVDKVVYAYRINHKLMGEWTRKKTEDCYIGMRKVWDVACRFNYSQLKKVLRRHIQDFIPYNRMLMTDEEIAFVEKVDAATHSTQRGLFSWLYSKERVLSKPGVRKCCVAGVKFEYYK